MAEDVLKKIYNACDPNSPASAEYYFDCSEARGGTALPQVVQRHLRRADDYTCFLLSGHIGCGKSSELAKLERMLTEAHQPLNCYFPVLVNVSEYLDDYDVTPTDILLAIVSELADALRTRLNVELRENYFTKRLNEIKNLLLSDVEDKEAELSLGFVKVKVQRLKKDPTARQKVREILEPKMSTMLEEINLIFDEARLEIRKHRLANAPQPCSDLVIILDNLEKIRKIGKEEEGLASHRELFLERYTQLTGMRAHFIYTVPLRLVRSADGPQLQQRYGEVFVLPMIKVIERDTRNSYQPGIESVRAILQKRLGDVKLDDAFTAEALDFLLKYSGGHVRNLMNFVQNASVYTDVLPIPLSAVQQAIRQTVNMYSTAIPETHWAKLAQLDLSADQHIPNGDGDYLKMLENLSIMEYINGGDEDPFSELEPWYAVNPIVRELKKFKEAVETVRTPVEAIQLPQHERE
jgi:hypothetical protein